MQGGVEVHLRNLEHLNLQTLEVDSNSRNEGVSAIHQSVNCHFLWKDELMMHSMVVDALMGEAV